MATYNVLDVSHHQNNKGAINWAAVKAGGFWGVIIKAGGSDEGFYKDSYFESNYAGAKAAGLHVGSYYYVGSGCTSTADGEADAKRFIAMLSGKQFDLPVYLDFEAPSAANKRGNTDAAIGFCEVMENAGFYTGIYASDISGFADRLDKKRLTAYTWWVAKYSTNPPTNAVPYGMWQYSSSIGASGITGNVDHNYCYVDYPSIITAGGYNGYAKGTTPAPSPAPTPTPSTPTTSTGINVGDLVRIKSGATDLNTGKTYASFVYSTTYTVKQVSGNRIVFGTNSGITGATDVSNVTLVGSTGSSSIGLAVGSSVRIKSGATDLNTGKTYASFVYNTVYTVKQISGDRVVFGTSSGITGATSKSNVTLA